MVGEVKTAAGFAVKDVPAQSGSAAMSDGPDGAALFWRKGRMFFEEVGQKRAQGVDDGGGGAHESQARVSEASLGRAGP